MGYTEDVKVAHVVAAVGETRGMTMRVFVSVLLVGCGGGHSTEPDARINLDHDGWVDQVASCAVQLELGNLNLVSAMPSDWIDTDRTGALAGRTVLTLGGSLPSSTAGARDVLVFDYVKPTTGGFALNTAVSFDPDPKAAPYVAASYIFGDLDVSTMTVGNAYHASTGSITLTAVGETSGAAINGTITETKYLEIDDGKELVPNGCYARLTGMTFDVVHDGMNFAPPPAGAVDGLQPLDREAWAAVRALRGR